MPVFTQNYEVNEQEYGIVNRCVKEVTCLRYKRYWNDYLWIGNNVVWNYIKQINSLYGGTFSYKEVIIIKSFLII